ncbi:MAG: AAA family ATPase, partial [Clostridiales bacterium]|nr:AAA family ATPase [Candidatus Coliplasma caballi]
MLFYKTIVYNAKTELPDGESCTRGRKRVAATKMRDTAEKFNARLHGEAFFAFVGCDDEKAAIVSICTVFGQMEKNLSAFLRAVSVSGEDIKSEEITYDEMTVLLSDADQSGFLEDDDEILKKFGLDFPRYRLNFGENMIEEVPKKVLYERVGKTLYAETLLPEFDRIYAGARKNIRAYGHPCHYMMLTVDEDEVRRTVNRALLSALYTNGRLSSRRYWYTDIDPTNRIPKIDLERLFVACKGGSIILRYDPVGDDGKEGNVASANRESVEMVADLIKKYRNETLVILCIPYDAPRVKMMFYEALGSLNVVECKEEYAKGDVCRDYLKMLCRENKIRGDKKLYAGIEESKGYRAKELKTLFDEWYNEKLRTDIYPQYSSITKATEIAVKKKEDDSAYEKLTELVGLDEVKKVIRQVRDYFMAQRLFKEKGFHVDRPAMSMVFTGNPGSCKTTVARLVAEIFRDCGILTEGRMIECGRGDLVGKYLGHTAPMVQRKFREAKGSVLFIDEAYSLVDHRDGMYGDEAINTIVQEMENHRDDVLVIFAGYPDKMEGFLNKNPGLRSRIAFHVHFDDYNADEPCQISELIAKGKGLTVSDEAL